MEKVQNQFLNFLCTKMFKLNMQFTFESCHLTVSKIDTFVKAFEFKANDSETLGSHGPLTSLSYLN